MVQPFCIRIADLTVELHPLFEATRTYCQDYVVDDATPDIVVASSESAIEQELAVAEPGATATMADNVVLYRAIANQLPNYNAVVVHGAALEYDGKAYLFVAPSGTGKSTHIRAWRKAFGRDMQIVNGDKPILRLTETGVEVCSTPWAGKEGWQRNCIVPLGGICLLRRGETNRIQRVHPLEQFDPLLRQVYCPVDGEALDKTLQILDTILTRVPFYVLDCTISTEAAVVARDGLTGGNNV